MLMWLGVTGLPTELIALVQAEWKLENPEQQEEIITVLITDLRIPPIIPGLFNLGPTGPTTPPRR